MRRQWLIFFVLGLSVLVSVALVAGCGGQGQQENTPGTSTTSIGSTGVTGPASTGTTAGTSTASTGSTEGTSVTQPEATGGSDGEPAEYEVGETFQVNDLTWTVLGTEQLSQIEGASSDSPAHTPENGAYFVVTLDLAGKEGLTGGFDTATLKLQDAEGNLYDVAEPSGAADAFRLTHDDLKNLSMAMLGETQPQHLFAIYDVPDDAGPFTLEWMGANDGQLVELARVSLAE
jgi:hypothetical protein